MNKWQENKMLVMVCLSGTEQIMSQFNLQFHPDYSASWTNLPFRIRQLAGVGGGV